MYQALYRKWRPKTFDDLVGQDHIALTLRNQVAGEKLSHAYLFCGSRGTGKTSTAKILAKAANCLEPRDGNPCCACALCRSIEQDTCLDVTEIDAASNSGVDNIRELRDQANFTPTAAKYRVYIIDETHMLSPGAFNALLKIMEEPPEHVLFILATTEIHKVPATILSRCQRYDFRRIPADIIAGRLEYVAGQENIELDGDAAALIAKLSDGGMRDALSLLDLCMASGERVSANLVGESVGITGQAHLFEIATALADGDAGKALDTLEQLWARSGDPVRLCEQMIGFYRNAMVVKAVREPQELVACLPNELEQYRAFVGGMGMERIFHCLDQLQETLGKMGRSSMRRTELEMAMLKLAGPELSGDMGAVLARMDRLERSVKHVPARAAQEPVEQEPAQKPEKQAAAQPSEKPQKAVVKMADPAPARPEKPAVAETAPAKQAPGGKSELRPFAQWEDVLEALKDKNLPLYSTLADSKAYVGEGLLLVDAGSDMFTKMMRGDSYAKESLRDAVMEVTGQKYRLGPYNPERYAVKEEEQQQINLDALLKRASDLGVDVEVK